MKKILSFSLVFAIILAILMPASVFAVTDYSGGLLDGKALQTGKTSSNQVYTVTGVTYNVTDNNESTSFHFDPVFTNGYSYLIYNFPQKVKLTAYKLKVLSVTNLWLAVYYADGTTEYFGGDSSTSNVTVNGMLGGIGNTVTITPRLNVVGVRLFNNYNANTNQANDIYEFNLYGQIQPPDAPNGLAATPGNAQVNLSWNTVTGATYYVLERSTTAGGPYIIVSNNVSGTSYQDTSVSNGMTYYYVVYAVNASGSSGISNVASATPKSPGRVILTITMTNGLQKEYNLSKDEYNAFVAWYDARVAGTGAATYSFANQLSKGPFVSRTNVIVFDKILTYDSDETDDTTLINTSVANPQPNDRVILIITMTNGLEKEYDLSVSQYNAFIASYNANGTSATRYSFTNQLPKAPFTVRSNDIILNKILTYDVDEYVPTP